MKRVALLALFVAITGLAFGQGTLNTDQVGGVKHAYYENGQVYQGVNPDAGAVIWDNNSISAWWSGVNTGYINSDWSTNFLVNPNFAAATVGHHVIDGAMFAYGTNNMDTAGEDFSIFYFDDCTGWGNLGTQQAGFLFAALPNGAYLPTLPPGYGWIWTITYDLEGGGYEFLLNDDFGIGLARNSVPTMGSTGLALGTRMFNGTQNAFDIFYPNGTYNGTWWFGSSYWATWTGQLMGNEGQGNGTFYGIGSQGNDSSLYVQGSFGANATVHFMGDKAGISLAGNLIASTQAMSQYIGNPYDVTRLIGNFVAGSPWIMTEIPYMAGNADMYIHDQTIPAPYAGMTAYFQMILSDAPLTTPPLDGSNGLRMN